MRVYAKLRYCWIVNTFAIAGGKNAHRVEEEEDGRLKEQLENAHVSYAKCRKTPVYFLLQQQQQQHGMHVTWSLLSLLLLLSVCLVALALHKHFIDEK